eukprot:536124-Rhodomonas_salina.1
MSMQEFSGPRTARACKHVPHLGEAVKGQRRTSGDDDVDGVGLVGLEGGLLDLVAGHVLVCDHLGAVRGEALQLVRHNAVDRLAPGFRRRKQPSTTSLKISRDVGRKL